MSRLPGRMEKSSIAQKKVAAALRAAPGLQNLLGYRREWLRHDAVFTGILCILAGFLRLGLCGGFSGQANSRGIPQRRGHPHLPRVDWQGLRLFDEIARDYPFAPMTIKFEAKTFTSSQRLTGLRVNALSYSCTSVDCLT